MQTLINLCILIGTVGIAIMATASVLMTFLLADIYRVLKSARRLKKNDEVYSILEIMER